MKIKTLLFVVLIIILPLAFVSCSRSEEVEINPKVEVHSAGNNEIIKLTNNDGFDWIDVDLGINADGFTVASGYTYSLNIIRAGQTVEIDVRDFTDGPDAERFNPFTTKMENFRIRVNEPNGNEDEFAEWEGVFGK